MQWHYENDMFVAFQSLNSFIIMFVFYYHCCLWLPLAIFFLRRIAIQLESASFDPVQNSSETKCENEKETGKQMTLAFCWFHFECDNKQWQKINDQTEEMISSRRLAFQRNPNSNQIQNLVLEVNKRVVNHLIFLETLENGTSTITEHAKEHPCPIKATINSKWFFDHVELMRIADNKSKDENQFFFLSSVAQQMSNATKIK